MGPIYPFVSWIQCAIQRGHIDCNSRAAAPSRWRCDSLSPLSPYRSNSVASWAAGFVRLLGGSPSSAAPGRGDGLLVAPVHAHEAHRATWRPPTGWFRPATSAGGLPARCGGHQPCFLHQHFRKRRRAMFFCRKIGPHFKTPVALSIYLSKKRALLRTSTYK